MYYNDDDERIIVVLEDNDRGNQVRFELEHIKISNGSEFFLDLNIKNKSRELYKLIEKVIDDTANDYQCMGGSRELEIITMDGKEKPEDRHMVLDIYSTNKGIVQLTFNLETLQKGRNNDICFVDLSLYKAQQLLELWRPVV